MKRLPTRLFLALVLAGGAALAAEGPRPYLILTKGQGTGSMSLEDLMASAGGTITGRLPEIGVVLASSANPAFLALVTADARVQQAAEDVEVPWIPSEKVAVAEESDLQISRLNSEPYWGYQWNIRQIRADQTAVNGDRGWGTKRARVAVLDAGIWAGHPAIG